MNPRKGLVLDANILMRAVLGRRVGELLETYAEQSKLLTETSTGILSEWRGSGFKSSPRNQREPRPKAKSSLFCCWLVDAALRRHLAR
jgi:hypothetical protein